MSLSESVPVPDPDEALETLLWGGSRNRCHIEYEGESRCGVEGLRRKDVAAVPPSHREWCRRCVALWREAATDGRASEAPASRSR